MKSIYKLILISAGLLCAVSTQAQIEDGAVGLYNEALLFSQTAPIGNARMQGIGGAQIALGGDISSALSNPAGLGFFNKSEFSFTPTLNFKNVNSDYFGVNTEANKVNFNLNQLGVVINKTKSSDNDDLWRGGSFGISVSRINDFRREFTYEANNQITENSIIDHFIENAEGIPLSDINNAGLSTLAFDTFIINPTDIDGEYDSFIPGFPLQTEKVTTTGSQYQWSFSYGGNYADKFYFGLGLGLVSIDYNQEKVYEERDFDVQPAVLNDLQLVENLDIQGSGINATLGFIFRPINEVRFGASITTPTYYSLEEQSDVSLFANYNNIEIMDGLDTLTLGAESSQSDIFISEYDLSTPLKLSGGLAFFIGKSGFISADLEYLDYSNASYSSDLIAVNADNRTIDNIYESVINYRIGGEFRYNILRFRAGYAYQADPVKDSFDNFDRSKTSISFGAGIRAKNTYFDLAIVNTQYNSQYSPYSLSTGGPIVNIDDNITKAVFTLGFKF